MFNRILIKLKDREIKRIFENYISLSLLQAANYLLPLITLPYLVRVLGPEKYGLIIFAQALILYCIVITDYGFNLSATREVSISRNNHEKLLEIFSTVMAIKLFLIIICFAVLAVIVLCFKRFSSEWEVYFLTFGMAAGHILIPVWFFQGIEKMKYITLLNVTAKLIFTISIFIFIRGVDDYIFVPLINSLGFITAGLISIYIIIRYFKMRLIRVNFEMIKFRMKDGWYIFTAGLSGNLYEQGTIIILGLISTNAIVGYYSVAEKLAKAFVNIFNPFAQAIFPYLSVKVADKNDFKKIFKKIFLLISVISMVSLIAVLMLSKVIYTLVSGYESDIGILSLRILAAFVPFTIMNVILNPFIISLKLDRLLQRMYFVAGMSFVILCYFLTTGFDYKGTAVSLVIVQAIIFIWSILLVRKGLQE